MPYDSLGGVKAAFIDGMLRQPRTTSQPRVMVIGPAVSGKTNEPFSVAGTSAAETEFGASTSVMRGVHELLAQGANNIGIMRSGGKAGYAVLTDSASNTLTITPSSHDDEILERYALVVENDGTSNRYLVYDIEDQVYVYDSSEIEVLDEGIVELDGIDNIVDLWQVNDRTDITSAISLADMVVGDFDTSGDNVAPATYVGTEGTDGTSDSLVERYASLNTSYFNLDYQDADFLLPMDVYIDDENIAEDASQLLMDIFGLGFLLRGLLEISLGTFGSTFTVQRSIRIL